MHGAKYEQGQLINGIKNFEGYHTYSQDIDNTCSIWWHFCMTFNVKMMFFCSKNGDLKINKQQNFLNNSPGNKILPRAMERGKIYRVIMLGIELIMAMERGKNEGSPFLILS